LSQNHTRPPGASARSTSAQNRAQRAAGTCDSQNPKQTASNRRGGVHDVVDVAAVVLGAVDLQRLRRGVDRKHPVGVPQQLPGPDAGACGQLQHLPAGREAVQGLPQQRGVGTPRAGGLLAKVVAAATLPPVVILRRPSPVIGDLLGQ
jgi:hypothetical protein